MNIAISLYSELLKTRRTSLLLLCILAAAFMPLMMFFEFGQDDLSSLKGDPWNLYYLEGQKVLNILFLPLYIILVCTIVPQIEYRNNTWKQVFSAPQSLRTIFLSKFLIVHLLILLFFIFYNLCMALSALTVHFYNTEINFFDFSLDWNKLMITNFKAYVSILAISAIQFWLGMRYKNFLVSIGTGLILWFLAGMLVFELHWTHADLFPFSYPMLITFSRYEALTPFVLWSSLVFTIIILGCAFIDLRFRKVKAGH